MPSSTDRSSVQIARRPYSPAVTFDRLVFVSGQLPFDPVTGRVVAGGIAEHTTMVMHNLQAVLRSQGSDLPQLLRTTVYLTARAHWDAMNEVYLQFVHDPPPARTAVVVAELGFGALVEIDAIGYRDHL